MRGDAVAERDEQRGDVVQHERDVAVAPAATPSSCSPKPGIDSPEHLLVVRVRVEPGGRVERDDDEVAGAREQAGRGLGIGADVVLDAPQLAAVLDRARARRP